MFIPVIQTIGILLFTLVLQLAMPTPDYQVIRKPERVTVKGIYLTAYTAGWRSRRDELIGLVNDTELNSVVIDIKDASGRIFFDTAIPLADQIDAEEIRIPDLKQWLAELKEQGIYTIARIVVFQDPYLANKMPAVALRDTSGGIWRDYKGQSWVDPTNRLVWDYNIDLARAAAELGFDEINFDYIRFPSDGNIKQIVYANLDNGSYEAKNKVMAEFYRYLGNQMAFEPAHTSADLFGMTLWRSDGMNIGQRYEDAAAYFDYIMPMVYPSHYPPNFEGFANPAEHPYEIIYRSLIRAKKLVPEARSEVRPWLQAFDLGAVYTGEMIDWEKQATYDAQSTSWVLWNASNRYSSAGLVSD